MSKSAGGHREMRLWSGAWVLIEFRQGFRATHIHPQALLDAGLL